MHRILERLDAAAGTLVPLLYLFGLMLGAVSYFAGITLNFGLAVGLALAGAAELHSFLQQRRVRAAYARLERLTEDDPEREQAQKQFTVNTWILVGLLAFSAINAIAFAAETWTPVPGPTWWRWAQIIFRGLVIPMFFLAAGFLTPLHTDASEQLQSTSAAMLRRTLKAIDRQWRGRLKRAEKRNADLAPVAIALLQEQGDHKAAKRLALIAQGLHTAESGAPLASLAAAIEQPSVGSIGLQGIHALPTQHLTPPTPQTQAQAAPERPLSPREQRRRQLEADQYTDLDEYDPDEELDANAPADDYGEYGDDGPDAPLYTRQAHITRPRSRVGAAVMSQQAAPRSRAQAARIAPKSAEMVVELPQGKTARKDDTPEQRRVMNYLDRHPSATVDQIIKGARVSKVTAKGHRQIWRERRRQLGEVAPASLTEELPAITTEMLEQTLEQANA